MAVTAEQLSAFTQSKSQPSLVQRLRERTHIFPVRKTQAAEETPQTTEATRRAFATLESALKNNALFTYMHVVANSTQKGLQGFVFTTPTQNPEEITEHYVLIKPHKRKPRIFYAARVAPSQDGYLDARLDTKGKPVLTSRNDNPAPIPLYSFKRLPKNIQTTLAKAPYLLQAIVDKQAHQTKMRHEPTRTRTQRQRVTPKLGHPKYATNMWPSEPPAWVSGIRDSFAQQASFYPEFGGSIFQKDNAASQPNDKAEHHPFVRPEPIRAASLIENNLQLPAWLWEPAYADPVSSTTDAPAPTDVTAHARTLAAPQAILQTPTGSHAALADEQPTPATHSHRTLADMFHTASARTAPPRQTAEILQYPKFSPEDLPRPGQLPIQRVTLPYRPLSTYPGQLQEVFDSKKLPDWLQPEYEGDTDDLPALPNSFSVSKHSLHGQDFIDERFLPDWLRETPTPRPRKPLHIPPEHDPRQTHILRRVITQRDFKEESYPTYIADQYPPAAQFLEPDIANHIDLIEQYGCDVYGHPTMTLPALSKQRQTTPLSSSSKHRLHAPLTQFPSILHDGQSAPLPAQPAGLPSGRAAYRTLAAMPQRQNHPYTRGRHTTDPRVRALS